jgi:integrase
LPVSRSLHKLSAVQIRSLPPGKYSDGGGLWLVKRQDGGGQWVQRVTLHGRRREMGLGSLRDVTLKEARQLSEGARTSVRHGKDPIRERKKLQRQAAAQEVTLAGATAACFEARKAQLKDDGKAARWLGPLETHVLPKLGKVPVADIDQNDIRDVMRPIWHTKPSMAQKAIERVGIVMRHAVAAGLDVDVQATTKARALLGKQRHKPVHQPALPWAEVPAFYASLEATPTHLALKLLILTAVRSAEARFLHLDEIEGDVWTIPAQRMKTAREHRVPLSQCALEVLTEAKKFAVNGHPFVGPRGKPLSDSTLSALMKRRGLEARPHGFRSSFRTWCAEATETPEAVAESALAHTVGSAVERAYRRTDHLDQRRTLMERWAAFVTAQ